MINDGNSRFAVLFGIALFLILGGCGKDSASPSIHNEGIDSELLDIESSLAENSLVISMDDFSPTEIYKVYDVSFKDQYSYVLVGDSEDFSRTIYRFYDCYGNQWINSYVFETVDETGGFDTDNSDYAGSADITGDGLNEIFIWKYHQGTANAGELIVISHDDAGYREILRKEEAGRGGFGVYSLENEIYVFEASAIYGDNEANGGEHFMNISVHHVVFDPIESNLVFSDLIYSGVSEGKYVDMSSSWDQTKELIHAGVLMPIADDSLVAQRIQSIYPRD